MHIKINGHSRTHRLKSIITLSTMKKLTLTRTLATTVIWLVSQQSVQPAEPFGIQGNIGIFYDMYNYSTLGYDDFRPRFPSDLARFSAHATVTAGKHFSMPFGIDITNQSTAYHLPSLPEERLIDYVQNPRNNININPTYKWAQAYLGSQSPNFSSLTTGDIPIFGVGIELNPGKFLFSAHYGRSQLAINANPVENIVGAYEQRILASRIGFGQAGGTLFTLNMVYRNDEESSVDMPPAGLQPQQGFTLSPRLQIQISETVKLVTETAGSAFSHDLNGPAMPMESELLDQAGNLIPVNGSTNPDFSNISSLEWQSSHVGLGGEVRYIGPGFEPVGYRAMERDLIDYNLKANLRLWDNRLLLNGTAGIRQNNLQNNQAESTTRIIANANLYTQITEAFNISTMYSNFGFRNNVLFDTLKVEMIQNMFSVTPGLQVTRNNINHIINATASIQLFDEFNVFTGEFISTRSTSYNASYNLVFTSIPFNIGLMGMYLQNETPAMDLDLYHIGLTARYRIMGNRLIPSVMLAHSGITREGFTTDHRWRANLRASYEVRQSMELRLGYTYSYYQYGSVRNDAATHEHRLQISLAQRF